MKKNRHWQINIDTGGTFTDCIGRDPDGDIHRCKVLSSSALRGRVAGVSRDGELSVEQSWGAPEGFINGFGFQLAGDPRIFRVDHFDAGRSTIRLTSPPEDADWTNAAFEVTSDEEAPVLGARLMTRTGPGEQMPPVRMRLATTKGTNALLERKGSSTLFLVTEGFGDLLRIGNQQRPDLFSLQIRKADPFCTDVLEIPERIDRNGKIIRKLNQDAFGEELNRKLQGTESAAICLMNSYLNPEHEKILESILKKRGVTYISVSSDLSRTVKILPRAKTTEINAYLDPMMAQYITNVSSRLKNPDLSIMTSTGGLTKSSRFRPKDGLLSGPAGGITGAVTAGKSAGMGKLITFDMGGTSTDVSRYDHGYDYQREHKVGDAELTAPALAIETVAAGGGSICDFDGKSLTVGPGSAGADPGPACYNTGGPLTITDVNLLSGRIDPENFQFPVDMEAAKEAFHELFYRVREERGDDVSGPEILQGFLDIANEKMAQAISTVSTAKGFNPAEYSLIAFGGAGGQHATAVAARLGIKKVIMPPDAGLLSAYGLDHARVEKIESLQCLKMLSEIEDDLDELFRGIVERATEKLIDEGIQPDRIEHISRSVFARLEGQESTLELPRNPGKSVREQFRSSYKEAYGHWIENKNIEVESIQMILAEESKRVEPSLLPDRRMKAPFARLRSLIYRGRNLNMPVIHREQLKPGMTLVSPLLILDPFSTLFAEPGWELVVRSDGTIELNRREESVEVDNNACHAGSETLPETGHEPSPEHRSKTNTESEPGSDNRRSAAESGTGRHSEDRDEIVNLQLYMNRFSAIGEQMGEMLRRTALSVNVKERLDFSCALLDADGYLIANAPHIPVHLGAIGLCVRTLLESVPMEEGDMILTNHPRYGGSHLPDITLISPVFQNNSRVAFVANRAHHAEIGGKTPGSMPPDAKSLEEEGVVFSPFHLIRKGAGRWSEVRTMLEGAPWPTRAVEENLADLQAGVAANHHGAKKMRELIDSFGVQEVDYYMKLLRLYAAGRMRQTLQKMEDGLYSAEEQMDDGSRLVVNCRVAGDRMQVDFSGTAGVHPGNLNANPSIVNSVMIYVMRLLVNEPLPLNDGLLEPIDFNLPESMLNPNFPDDPSSCPAVVGGNIETSQRLVDTLLKAFSAAACSQGTMNNILFGNDRFGYYETVAGGTGAGRGFNGTDGVHHHMTNTRATDPEILEQRYPARLDRFAFRKGSGGSGKWRGGEGLVREITFLEPLELSILSQHRIIAPYGLQGGRDGLPGSQRIVRRDGSRQELEWKDSTRIEPGDRLILETPGGGGFGDSSIHK